MFLRLIISIIIGGALGLAMHYLSKVLIKRRTKEEAKGFLFENKYALIVWIALGILGGVIVSLMTEDILKHVEYMAVYFILLCLSVVDGSIRKIPNELLIALLVLKIASAAVVGQWGDLLPALYGFIVGWVFFVIPSMLKISIGWGDVKLAAIAGFYLGIIGLIQAVLIMGILLGIYGVYLLVTKKGNLKSKVAIGPPLSVGIFISLLVPLAAVIQI